jgi:hypothetical protein
MKSGGGLLWTRLRAWVTQGWEIWLVEWLLVSQEGPCFIDMIIIMPFSSSYAVTKSRDRARHIYIFYSYQDTFWPWIEPLLTGNAIQAAILQRISPYCSFQGVIEWLACNDVPYCVGRFASSCNLQMGSFYQHLSFVSHQSSVNLLVFREKLHCCGTIMCFRTVSIILVHLHLLLSPVVLFRVSPATPLWIPAPQTPCWSKAKR